MNARIVIGTLAAVVLLGSAAVGPTARAAMNPDEQCNTWMKQFDTEIKTHATHAKAAEAKKLAATGTKECKEKKQAEGAKNLEAALKDIGVKPKQ